MNSRFLLYMAFFLVLFMIWQQWQIEQNPRLADNQSLEISDDVSKPSDFPDQGVSSQNRKSSASKPEPVEVLKTFFVEGQVPSDEALSAASEPYVENWKSRSEPIEIESSVRRDAQKVADTSDGRDAQKAGESRERTGTRLDDVTQEIKDEIDQNSEYVNKIETAKADLIEMASRVPDIGEPFFITEVYKVLRRVPGILDVTDVIVQQITGENSSSFSYNIPAATSQDGRFIKMPKNVIYEIKFPESDISGVIL